MTRTADLLRGPLMAEIDAVKIDVQGYEQEVLEGLRPYINQVQLLLVELSLVECYVGAPDLFSLDRFIVEDLGFERISIEPSYYDDLTGTVQQYDGIYAKRPAKLPGRSLNTRPPTFGAIFTSLHGKPSRIGPSGEQVGEEWFERCVQSWRQHTSRIVSVSDTAPLHSDIQWVKVEARPSIAEIFAVMNKEPDIHAILCNGDILLTRSLAQLRDQLDPAVVYLANRVNVELNTGNPATLDLKAVHGGGFDAFILPSEFIGFVTKTSAIPPAFRIGEPWWDYVLPIVALAGGFPVKRLPVNQPVALHYQHPSQFDAATWSRLGEEFLATVGSLARLSTAHARGFLDEILRIDGPAAEKLPRIAQLVITGLS